MAVRDDRGVSWSEDWAIVENPSSTSFLVPNFSTSGKVFLPLAVQPLLALDPHLRNAVQRGLYSSEAAHLLLAGLSMHEAGAVWMLLNSTSWQHAYQTLQHALINKDNDGLKAFIPYLKLLNAGLQMLPQYRGNLWYYCDKDVSELYPRGTVFNWSGFMRFKIQHEMTFDETDSKTAKTVFCIQTSSGRIVVPFSDFRHENVPVVISPNTFFQVVSLSKLKGNTFLISVKEIHSPYAVEPNDSLPDQSDQRCSQQYWDKLLQNMNPLTSSAIFLTVQNVAQATANVPLYCSVLQRLSEISSFQCTNTDIKLMLATNLKEMKRFPCYIAIQLFGCSVLNTLFSDTESRTSQVDATEVQSIVVNTIHHHKESKDVTRAGFKLLKTLSVFSVEFSQPKAVVDIVLSGMKHHSEEKDIQILGCSLLDTLSQKMEYVSLINEAQGRKVIVNALQLQRSEQVVSETCWRTLFRLVKLNNNNNNSDVEINQYTDTNSFFELLKEVLRAYSRCLTIQAEGLLTVMESLEVTKTLITDDTSYSELILTAMRTHGSSETIVETSFVILVELTKSSEITKFLIDREALTCILSAMNQYFDVENIQENGCKILRNIAKNGCHVYRKYFDIRYGSLVPNSESQEDSIDFRLKIVESGGLDVIISAMKTHSSHVGTQREGCLTIRTLSVNAVNAVEGRETEDVRAVLSTLKAQPNTVVLQTAALRALAILTIHPLNREFVILNSGVECTLHALRSFPECRKLLGGGVATLGNLSQDTDGALFILQKKGLQMMLMLIESEKGSEIIFTSTCTVIANLCSLPHHLVKVGHLLPTDIMFENDGYHRVAKLVNSFPENTQLQKESYRVICTLPRVLPTSLNKIKDSITHILFKSVQNVSDDVQLMSLRCRAIGRLITFFDIFDTMIPDQIVDWVLSMIQQYRTERDLIKECCITLSIMMTNGVGILRSIFEKGGVTSMIHCLEHYKSDKQIMILCLKNLNSIFPNQLTRTIWEILNPFQTTLREITRHQIISVGGMETMLDILTNNIEDSSIVLLVAPLFLISFSRTEPVTNNNILTRINEFLTDIRHCYSDGNPSIHVFCDELSYLVNL